MLYQTEFTLKITLSTDLSAGATLTRHFCHILADGSFPNWELTRVNAAGVILDHVNDQSLTDPGRVVVILRNITASAIPSATILNMVVRRM